MNISNRVSDELLLNYCQSQSIQVSYGELKFPRRAIYLATDKVISVVLADRIFSQYIACRSALALCLGYHLSSSGRPRSSDAPLFFEVLDNHADLLSLPSREIYSAPLLNGAFFFSDPLIPDKHLYLADLDTDEFALAKCITKDLASQVLWQLQHPQFSYIRTN